MRGLLPALAVAWLVGAGAAPAVAQWGAEYGAPNDRPDRGVQDEGPSELEPPDLSRFYRWGALRVRPGLQIWRVGYNDNIFLDDENPVSDFTATIAPKLQGLLLLGDRAFFDFTARLDYRTYLKTTDENYLDHRGRGRVTLPIGASFGVFGEYVLDYTHQRPRDEVDIRPLQKDRRLGLGLIFEVGWRTELEVSQHLVGIRFEDEDNPDIALRLDRDEVRRRVSAKYKLKGRTKLTADVETRDITFRFNDPLKDSDQWLFAGGMRFGYPGRLTGAFRLGWSQIDSHNPERPDFSGPIGDAEIVYRFSTGSRIEFGAEVLPGFSVVRNQTYYESTQVGLRGVQFINRIFGIEAGVVYDELNYPETQSDGTDLIDDLYRYDLGVRVRMSQNAIGSGTAYSFRIGRARRQSTDPSRNRTRTTVYFGTSLGF